MSLKGILRGLSGTGRMLGFLTGGLIFSLGIWTVNSYMLKNKGNPVSDEIEQAFIKENIELKVKSHEMEFISGGHADFKATFSNSHGQYIDTDTYYIPEYKKYFQFRFYYPSLTFGHALGNMQLGEEPIVITVSKQDFEDPKLGDTREAPVPVFRAVGYNQPIHTIRGGDTFMDHDITEKMYFDNIYIHLWYFMPEEEFLQRFGHMMEK